MTKAHSVTVQGTGAYLKNYSGISKRQSDRQRQKGRMRMEIGRKRKRHGAREMKRGPNHLNFVGLLWVRK